MKLFIVRRVYNYRVLDLKRGGLYIHMTKHTRKTSLTITIILLISTLFPLLMHKTYAAIPKLDQIRVALFIDARGTIPAVTISSADGLKIGIRHPSGMKPWFTHSSNNPIRG